VSIDCAVPKDVMSPPLSIVVEPRRFWMSPVRMTGVLTALLMLIAVDVGPTKSVVALNPFALDELTVRFAVGCATMALMPGITRDRAGSSLMMLTTATDDE